jgi:uncharacterized YccA/Bax inhibitor family protein
MAANPLLSEKSFQQRSGSPSGWVAPDATGAGAGAAGARYGAGSPPVEGGGRTMTIGGSLTATGVLLVLLVAAGAFGWSQVEQVTTTVETASGTVVQNNTTWPSWTIIAALVGLGLGLVTAFKPKVARVTAPLYALTYGTVVGAISAIYNASWNGIVVQAVLATIGVALVMFLLYAFRIIKVTPKLVIGIVAATGGVFLMYMVAWIGSLFGADLYFFNNPSPLGIGISVVICGVAAFNLLLDFNFIEQASKEGYPAYMEWFAAYCLTVSLVWLYLEVLRLLSLLNSR